MHSTASVPGIVIALHFEIDCPDWVYNTFTSK